MLLAIVGATLGKVALVPEMDSFHIQRSLGVFRTTKLIHPQHLSYVFESKDFQSLLWENAGFQHSREFIWEHCLIFVFQFLQLLNNLKYQNLLRPL